MGGAGVTVTATTVKRRRILGEINIARRKEEKERRRERAQEKQTGGGVVRELKGEKLIQT